MPDPVTTLYGGIPGYFFVWLLALVSGILFVSRITRYVTVLAHARPEIRWDHVPDRLKLFVENVLLQKRLLQERLIGIAHFVIFWAFALYATTFFWTLARALFPVSQIPYPDEIGWVSGLLVAFSVLGLAAITVAAVRRYLFPPERLERSVDAGIILALIAVVLLSSLGAIVAKPGLPRLSLALWWTHIVTVLAFLAYLPYSKHLHLLAAPFGVFFGSRRLSVMPGPSEGASVRDEFTWRQLFSGLACAECGRCDRACPSVTTGSSFSPKELMEGLKQLVRAQDGTRKLAGDVLREEQIWACTTCAACMQRCPSFNEHLPALIEMRRYLVAKGDLAAPLQTSLTNLSRYGNSFGISQKARPRWTTELDFHVKDARKEPVEYLWFTGDYAAYDPRVTPGTRATARLFHRAGLDFGILYESEQNSGADARRVGEEGLFETLVEKNRQALGRAHFEKIVTTDPHTYHALKNEYPPVNGTRAVLHYTEVLWDLLKKDRLQIRQQRREVVTYHDPCYLGRYNSVYEAPRQVLGATCVDVVEMPRNRDASFCCGAGGGRIWMEDTAGSKERPSENRIREAASVPRVEVLAVSCPKDLVMFRDALKTTGLEGRLAVKDIAEVIEPAVD